MIETIKGSITYLTAALLALGCLAAAVWAWAQPIPTLPDGTVNVAAVRDIAVLFGIIGIILGNVLQFLFGGEVSTRTARATERAVNAGGILGAAQPETLAYHPALSDMPNAVEDEFVEEDEVEPAPVPTAPQP